MLPEVPDPAAFNKVCYQIHTSIPRLEGWASVEKCKDFARIVMALKPEYAMEIGVFGGRGLLAIALAMRANSLGVCYGIDPWSPAESIKDMDKTNADWWGNLDHERIYQGCLEAVSDWNVAAHVAILRMPSDDVCPDPIAKLGLLVIDGSHGPQSIRDVQRFAPLVQLGGYLYADDIGWDGGFVSKAIQLLPAMGFEEVKRVDEGAFFKRSQIIP